jgi:AcrR family transcriptional regulator
MTPAEVAAHQLERLHSATIEVVVNNGYADAKVRDISAVSGVSTRAFYEHFDSKQDCVLETYELVTRRATRRIIASQADEEDWRERAQLVLAAFANELKAAPSVGRFALVEARAAGPAARERVRHAEHNFEIILAEALTRAPEGIVVPPLLIEAVVAGITRVACARLVSGRAQEISGLAADLAKWAFCYASEEAGALEELDLRAGTHSMDASTKSSLTGGSSGLSSANGDRALILSAIAKLAATAGYTNLTIPRIRRAAGVSRKAYDEHFDGIEDCFVAALNQRSEEVLSRAALAQVVSHTWSGGLYRAIVALCEGIATDPFLASVCVDNDFNPGSRTAQARHRLIGAAVEQLTDSIPAKHRPSKLIMEASQGAIWGLFQNHLIKERALPSATLAYLALTPAIGPSASLAAICREQKE